MALSNDTILFVGLGNPGEKHKNNRHNVGFMALDCLSAFHKFGRSRTKFLGRTAMGSLDERKLISFKPQTFMNESGRAVREASNFYKIGPERIIVFHDELDLAPGKCRFKSGGGHAGHNGLKSIHSHIGENYQRVRLGIGHPGQKDLVSKYVLNNFSNEDQKWLRELLAEISENCINLANNKPDKFINQIALGIGNKKISEDNSNEIKVEKTSIKNNLTKGIDEEQKSTLKKLLDKFNRK